MLVISPYILLTGQGPLSFVFESLFVMKGTFLCCDFLAGDRDVHLLQSHEFDVNDGAFWVWLTALARRRPVFLFPCLCWQGVAQLHMALCMLTLMMVVSGVVTVEQDWEQALAHFGLQRPPLVTPVNFYGSLGAVDFVSPGTIVTINPLRPPQIPLRAICSHWHDFSCTGPNWRMVWVHDARRQTGNPLMQYPTYMVMKRGVDALLDRRPHGLVELLSFIPHKVNVVFPSVTPVKVNRPVVLQLLGNLGPYCTRFVHCRVWLNGAKLDTLMVDVQHGFYILVQLRAAPGVDAVMAKEATDSIVGHGRFLHLVSAPGVLIVHCPGGRTLLHSRSMQLILLSTLTCRTPMFL